MIISLKLYKSVLLSLAFIGALSGCTLNYEESEGKQHLADVDEIDVSTSIEIVSEKGVTLLANQTDDGLYRGITVLTVNASSTYDWVQVTNPTYQPVIHFADVNGDNKAELVIILTTGYGNGALIQEIHMIDTVTFIEQSKENPLEAIENQVTSTITHMEGKVHVLVQTGETNIEKTYDESYEGIWNDIVAFGSIVKYEVTDHKITAIIPGAVSPAEFAVTAVVEYDSELKANHVMLTD